jgi:hypothetical protein
MKMLRMAGMLALAGFMVLQPAAAWAWGAIAVSNTQASRWGYSYDHPTEREAINRAVQECGRGCKAAVTFRSGCGAYAYGAVGKDREYGIGVGSTRADAEDEALFDCEMMLWDDCAVRVWACNSR